MSECEHPRIVHSASFGDVCVACQSDAATVVRDLRARLTQATEECAEARKWVRRMTRDTRVLTCIYCGQAYPPGTPTHGAEVLTAHAIVCEKHPLATAVEALNWYAGLLSTSSTYPHNALGDKARKALEEIRKAAVPQPPNPMPSSEQSKE